IYVSGKPFQVTYVGRPGDSTVDHNDVVLTAINATNPVLDGTFDNDNFVVVRGDSLNHAYTSNTDPNRLYIYLNTNLIWDIPYSGAGSLSSLTLNGRDGNDTLTVDLDNNNALPGGTINFHGGNPASGTGDKVVIT